MNNTDETSSDGNDNNNQYEEIENFDDSLGEYADGTLVKGIYEYGFDRPSPIQAKTIPPILEGRDTIAQAQSGSGKTGAFVIASLTKIDNTQNYPQVIIVVNTHELAMQVDGVAKNISKHMNIKRCLCIGGKMGGDKDQKNNVYTNLRDAYNSHFLVATPGRLNDLIKRGDEKHIDLLSGVKILILDEADKLLTSFTDDIRALTKCIPKNTQVCMFSATYPTDSLEITRKIVKDPVNILIKPESVSVDMIKNYFVILEREEYKYGTLVDIYSHVSVCQTVIFVNSVKKADDLALKLEHDGHSVGVLHSKLDDHIRMQKLLEFRKMKTRILIATDIISRGIDVQQVGLVINYDVPDDPEQYIHRVGRSGRYGKAGIAITFVKDGKSRYSRFGNDGLSDTAKMENILQRYSINFEHMPSLDNINSKLTGNNDYSLEKI